MKRLICVLLSLCCMLVLGGWSFGPDPADYWGGYWYGWVEYTDADGEYAHLKGVREDCVAAVDLYATYAGKMDGFLGLYSQSFYGDPLLSVNANFGYSPLKILEDKAYYDEERYIMDGREVTSQQLSITNDIDIESGLWGEGTIANAAGSITLRMFCMRGDVNTWDSLRENRGTLELSYEELLPEHYDTWMQIREKANLDTDRLDPSVYFAGLTEPMTLETMGVKWAHSCTFDGIVSFCRLDNSDDFSQIVFESAVPLYRFGFLQLEAAGSDTGGVSRFTGEALREWDILQSNQPLLIQLTFHGDLPEYGIRFKDLYDRDYCYAIEISGEDGSLLLTNAAVMK